MRLVHLISAREQETKDPPPALTPLPAEPSVLALLGEWSCMQPPKYKPQVLCVFLGQKIGLSQRGGERAILVGHFTFCYHSPPYMYPFIYFLFSENDIIHFEDIYCSVEKTTNTNIHPHPPAGISTSGIYRIEH